MTDSVDKEEGKMKGSPDFSCPTLKTVPFTTGPGRVYNSCEGPWQPTPVFLPGKSHGQRSLPGYSPRVHKRVGHNLAIKQQQQGEMQEF